MIAREKLKRILVLSMLLAPGAIVGVYFMFPPSDQYVTDTDEHLGVAHASSLQGFTDCASCHTEPITVNCADCHTSPPTTVDNNISFPHHNPEPGGPIDNCQHSKCHDGGTDARFVVELEADHTYCGGCHGVEHGSPP
ncbi:MAG: hypothetical protein ACE5I5_01510 [Candidatus Heimdallarchaeota archaeon]